MTVTQRRAMAKAVFTVLFFALVVWIAASMSGCASTVIAEPVASRTIAFDGGEQTAGVLKVWPGRGALITDSKKAEYDALVAIYGRGTDGHKLTPPVVKGRGLTPLRGKDEGFPLHARVWHMDAQALADFILMRGWQRAGRVGQ
jgi:hypothetical protein